MFYTFLLVAVCVVINETVIHKLTPPQGGDGRTEERVHSRLLGGRCIKQGNLAGCLGQLQDKSIAAPSHQDLKVYAEALTGLSHIYHPDDINKPPSQVCVLGQLLASRRQVECRFQDRGDS